MSLHRLAWVTVSATTLCAFAVAETHEQSQAKPADGDQQDLSREHLIISTLPPKLRQIMRRELGITELGVRLNRESSNSYTSSKARRRIATSLSALGSKRPTTTSLRYFLKDLGTLGGTEAFAYGVNELGQIVGSARLTGDLTTHAFVYSDGQMTDLFPLNSESIRTVGPSEINDRGEIASGLIVDGVYYPAIFDSTSGQTTIVGQLGGVTSFGFAGVATSINNLGQAVGYSYVDAAIRHAFVHLDGVTTDIIGLGGPSADSAALDVNEAGTVVGFSATETSDGRTHAFVYSDGDMTDIDPYRGNLSESYARGINDLGEVVGSFLLQDQSAHRAFLYKEGAIEEIGFADSPETVAFAVNNKTQVVGVTTLPYEDVCFDPVVGGPVPCTSYTQHAFIYQSGQAIDLNALISRDLPWELGWAFDISDQGHVVGYGTWDGAFRAFVLIPATTTEQCKSEAWRDFGFASEKRCTQFVRSGR